MSKNTTSNAAVALLIVYYGLPNIWIWGMLQLATITYYQFLLVAVETEQLVGNYLSPNVI